MFGFLKFIHDNHSDHSDNENYLRRAPAPTSYQREHRAVGEGGRRRRLRHVSYRGLSADESDYTDLEDGQINEPVVDFEWQGVFELAGKEFFLSPNSNPAELRLHKEKQYLEAIRNRKAQGQLHLFPEQRMRDREKRHLRKLKLKWLNEENKECKQDSDDSEEDAENDASSVDSLDKLSEGRKNKIVSFMHACQSVNPKDLYVGIDKQTRAVLKRTKDSVFLCELESQIMSFKYHLPLAASSPALSSLNVPAASPDLAGPKPTTFSIVKRIVRAAGCSIYARHCRHLEWSHRREQLLRGAAMRLYPEVRMTDVDYKATQIDVAEEHRSTDHAQVNIKVDALLRAMAEDPVDPAVCFISDGVSEPVLILRFSDAYGRQIAHGVSQFHNLVAVSEDDAQGNRVLVISEPAGRRAMTAKGGGKARGSTRAARQERGREGRKKMEIKEIEATDKANPGIKKSATKKRTKMQEEQAARRSSHGEGDGEKEGEGEVDLHVEDPEWVSIRVEDLGVDSSDKDVEVTGQQEKQASSCRGPAATMSPGKEKGISTSSSASSLTLRLRAFFPHFHSVQQFLRVNRTKDKYI